MHTDSRKSNMLRLLHHCLIAVCLAGSLMLLPHCCAEVQIIHLEPEYDSTPSPDYDYNATFDYTFFSNSSNEELEMFFKEKETLDDYGILDITDSPSTESKGSNEAFRTVYSSLLLMLILAAHQLLRLL